MHYIILQMLFLQKKIAFVVIPIICTYVFIHAIPFLSAYASFLSSHVRSAQLMRSYHSLHQFPLLFQSINHVHRLWILICGIPLRGATRRQDRPFHFIFQLDASLNNNNKTNNRQSVADVSLVHTHGKVQSAFHKTFLLCFFRIFRLYKGIMSTLNNYQSWNYKHFSGLILNISFVT